MSKQHCTVWLMMITCIGGQLKSHMQCNDGILHGHLQNAKCALWFTDALLWNFSSTKPLFGSTEQRPTQTFPRHQLWTERSMCTDVGRIVSARLNNTSLLVQTVTARAAFISHLLELYHRYFCQVVTQQLPNPPQNVFPYVSPLSF